MRLTTSKKIYLLLFFPTLAMVVVITAFYQTENARRQFESKVKAADSTARELSKIMSVMNVSFSRLLFGKPDKQAPDARAILQINQQFSALESEASSDEQLAQLTKALKPLIEDQVKTLYLLESVPADNIQEELLHSPTFKQKMAEFSKRLEVINRIIEAQEKQLDEIKEAQKLSDQRNQNMAMAVGIFSILLTNFFSVRLARGLTQKLDTLIENSQNLFTEKPLIEIAGQDEFTNVNKLLKEASIELEQSKANRQHVIQMITHDLRTPVMTIILASEAMLKSPGEQPLSEVKERLKTIRDRAKKMSTLTSDFLLLEKIDHAGLSYFKDEIDVRITVDSCIGSVNELATNKNIKIENLCANEMLKSDEARFEQIIFNLLTNAIKYSPPDTTVEVKSETRPGFVQFSVLDQGPGLDKQDCARVFERYYRSAKQESEQEGFGVGLAIVKTLVEGQGGSVGLESVLGKGTRFWFTLPNEKA